MSGLFGTPEDRSSAKEFFGTPSNNEIAWVVIVFALLFVCGAASGIVYMYGIPGG